METDEPRARTTRRVASAASNAGGRETRQVLIRTAERLFAEHGIDAVSLRQISAAAGMRMSGAVGYHFGDKAGLVRAIIDDRSVQVDERCRPALADLEAQGRLHDLRAATTAVMRAAVEALNVGETGYYFRFLTQLDRHPQALLDLQSSAAFRESPGRIIEIQDEAASRHLPAKLVAHRRRLATHVVLAALADLESDAEQGIDEELVTDLIDCVVAIYSAESSTRGATAPARRAPRARSSRTTG